MLVAHAFVNNPNPTLFTAIKHINGNTIDNRAENLQWVHPSSIATKRPFAKKQTGLPKDKYVIRHKFEVLTTAKNGYEINLGVFDSLEEAKEAAKRFGNIK